jgi:threonine/homoserine/homoserine lactone efflux protein
MSTANGMLRKWLWVFPYRLAQSGGSSKVHQHRNAPRYEPSGALETSLMKAFKATQLAAHVILMVVAVLTNVLVPGVGHTENLIMIAAVGFMCIFVGSFLVFFIESEMRNLCNFFNGLYLFNRKLGKPPSPNCGMTVCSIFVIL